MDMRVVLVRLPIFDLLYERVERSLADFNSLIANIAEGLSVRYEDLNLTMETFTEGPEIFTDGSHLEIGGTE